MFGVLNQAVFGRVTKSPFKKSTHFSTVSAPLYAWRQNWIQFKKHLSDLSPVSSTLLLFGYAARQFQHVFTKSRRCHLDTAKQNLAVTQQNQTDITARWETEAEPAGWDYLAQRWVPPQSRSHHREITWWWGSPWPVAGQSSGAPSACFLHSHNTHR